MNLNSYDSWKLSSPWENQPDFQECEDCFRVVPVEQLDSVYGMSICQECAEKPEEE